MKRPFLTVRTVFTAFFLTVIFALLALLGGIPDRRGRLINWCARTWAGFLLFVNGVSISVTGLEQLQDNRQYVFMANHQSALDIPAIFVALPFQVRMMAKKELFRIPVFGWALSLGGYIKIDRENRDRAISSLQAAAERVVRRSESVVVFPEGTRSVSGKLNRFKKGGFMFALDTGYPVVPVTIDGARDRTPHKELIIYPGKIAVTIGEPIPLEEYSAENRDELIARTFDTIEQNLR
ncbi:MAG: 1-acyl-sn-glycerol-3-phosphate acyltransferase [Candidatus Marinimicrobia bacterium]|nr:1-acyl-sn-glycerol-3-phosphate acyltransferase [Candidatus Neomarinimicrobiota bacterium]MCF7830358.1 1-acyl-sn-glycerol-3-phosphate acyltransferase [Candidatus Neomarinimicrobiota bacterium]MCF7882454.1 1-acyl-sn-glycerol-3-phosphate acyltransferase [Candidatus Neomarinimicrobiota bacterium]